MRVWLFQGRFPATASSSSGVYTKNILLFGTIFRHVALLFTEISRQDQNFRIIPRIVATYSFLSS